MILMVLERLVFGYIGLCFYFYFKTMIPSFGKNGEEFITNMLEEMRIRDILVVLDYKQIRIILAVAGLFAFPFIPLVEAYEKN